MSRRAWGAFARRRGLDEGETHRFAMGRPTRETVALLLWNPLFQNRSELVRVALPPAFILSSTRHALPTLTLAGVQFGILFSGTLLVEVIYSYPGMGNLMVDAVRNADLPLIQAIGLTYCIVVLIINTVVDGLYVVLNPKLRLR